MIDAELLRNPAGIVDIGHRTTTGVAVATPQPHRDADNLVAGVDQFRRSNRRIDATAESNRAPSRGTSLAQPAHCVDDDLRWPWQHRQRSLFGRA